MSSFSLSPQYSHRRLTSPSTRLRTFLAHIYQFNFGLDIHKFQLSLSLPPTSPMAPHPALLNAIYLVGSHWALGDPALATSTNQDTVISQSLIQSYIPHFYHFTQVHLDDALAHVDRLLDFLAATMILAQYEFVRGRAGKGAFLAGCKSTLCFFSLMYLPRHLSFTDMSLSNE